MAATLHHLPYSSLRKAETHEYGVLRLWIKLKNFKDLPGFGPPKWVSHKGWESLGFAAEEMAFLLYLIEKGRMGEWGS